MNFNEMQDRSSAAVTFCRAATKTIHEITRNLTRLFVLVRVISWIVTISHVLALGQTNA
jgi:hypothetical protein